MNTNLKKELIDNKKSGNRPAMYHSENSKNMNVLENPNDKIEVGIYAGQTLSSVLEYYGKRAFSELLKYYNISDDILIEYHCRLRPHEDKSQTAVPFQDMTSTIMEEKESQVKANANESVAGQVNVAVENEVFNTTSDNLDDNNLWTSRRSDYENSVLYDSEDDMPDTDKDKAMMAKGCAHLYWDGESFHLGTSVNY